VPAHNSPVASRTSPIAVPTRPWLWSQHWLDLLFAHWQVPPEVLRPHVPSTLEIDSWNGLAYVSAVAFRMDYIRPRGLPSLGWFSRFLELNLRTYVIYRGEPAVYFLSIHAGKRVAVFLARCFTPLPYVYARMHCSRQAAGGFRYDSERATAGGDAVFKAEFTPVAEPQETRPESLEAWLLERYCLYADDARDTLFRAVVRHRPWTYQPVTGMKLANTLGSPFGLDLTRPPDKVHFSPGLRAVIWPFGAVETH
jgi:uncharacterized protein